MAKNTFFSKINKKDYNNILEEILETKYFSADVKNLLLNTFYKIEIGYNDYQKVKRDVKPQEKFIEECLEVIKKCDEIELVKPMSKESEILDEKNAIVDMKKNRITVYQTEKAMITGICTYEENGFYIPDDILVAPILKSILLVGNNINSREVIYDFDGWSWNTELEDIETIQTNLIYQNIQLLIGHKILEAWKKDNNNKTNYIEKIDELLQTKYGKETAKEILNNLTKLLNCLLIKKHPDIAKKYIKNIKPKKERLEYIKDKTKYIEDICKTKKEANKQIKKIDKLLSSKNLLIEEYKARNEKLKDNEKIFSISSLVDILNNERTTLINEIKQYNKNMKPAEYLKAKSKLEQEINDLEQIKQELKNPTDIQINLINMQKSILKAIEKQAKKVELKDEIEDLIYKIRYYKYTKIDSKNHINDIKELTNSIKSIEWELVKRACNAKLINIISTMEKDNIEIIIGALTTNVIDLDATEIILKNEDGRLKVEVYDGEVLEKTFTLDAVLERIQQKFNKKIKIFI